MPEHTMLLKALESLREQVGADPWQAILEVCESAGTGYQFTDHEKRPPFADNIQGVREPTILIVASIAHI